MEALCIELHLVLAFMFLVFFLGQSRQIEARDHVLHPVVLTIIIILDGYGA